MSAIGENQLGADEDVLVAPQTSILDRIKERRALDSDEEWFDVPSWGGELKMQMQVLDPTDVEKMVRRVQARRSGRKQQSGAGREADLDFLVKACVGVKAVDLELDQEEVLTSGINEALAEMLDPRDPDTGESVDVSTSRKLLWYLLKFNGIALAAFGAKVARWMQDTSKPIEDPQ